MLPRDVVNQFLTKQEYCQARAYWMYKHFLDRDPEPVATESRGSQFMQGYSYQAMIADFCESPEFKMKHPLPKEYVRFLYYKILSRAKDPEVYDADGFAHHVSAIVRGTSLSNGLAAVTTVDGRIEVFVVGGDKKLYRKWQQSPGANWTPQWSRLDDAQVLEGMSVATNKDGRLEIFAIGSVEYINGAKGRHS